MKKAAAIILVLAMVFTLCACREISYFDDDAPTPDFDVCVDFSRVETEEICDEETGDAIFTKSICVPEVTAAGSKNAVEAINEDIQKQYELFAEGAESAKEYVDTVIEEGGSVPCCYNVYASLSRGDVGVISIIYGVYTYSGGAHGYAAGVSASYDARTGEKLSLDTVSEEPELLRQLIYGYILNISESDKYKTSTGESIFYSDSLVQSITELVQGENWYFDSQGLVFFANPYEMAAYAEGRVEFTVPYAAMDGRMEEKYLPQAFEGENGMMLAQCGEEAEDDDLDILASVTLDEGGQSVVLNAEDTVYNVTLSVIETSGDKTILWYRNYMTTGEAVEIISYIPDVQPNVILSYTMADGTVIERGVFQSGMEGSIILTELYEEQA